MELGSLEQEQSDLLQLLYLCPIAIARLDAAGNILLMNSYGAQLLMPISIDGSLTNLFELFDPFAPELAEMARRYDGRTGKICEEHRISLPPRPPNGTTTTVSVTLQKVDGNMSVAVLTDVTAAASRERSVRMSEERLHAVLDGLTEYSVCTVDLTGRVTSWNRAAERLDDYRTDEMIGRHVDGLVAEGRGVKSPMSKRLELARRDGTHQFEAWRVRKDGRRYWASISIALLHDKDGRSPIGFSVIAHDLTEQRRSEDRLRILATTDSLTGALNRRAFFDRAKLEHERAAQTFDWAAVLLVDADRFKSINDTHGHEAGDAILSRIVEDCRHEIRSHDILGRFGGEEFAIYLPGCDTTAAHDAAERICRRIAVSDGARIACTVSIGVAASRAPSETIEEAMRRADAAMYAAKAGGRNRVMIAAEPMPKSCS